MSVEFPTESEKLALEHGRRPDIHDYLLVNGRPAYVFACAEGEGGYEVSVEWLGDGSVGHLKYSTMSRMDSSEGLPKGKISIEELERIYLSQPEKLNALNIPVLLKSAHDKALLGLKGKNFSGFYRAEIEQ